ncbi:Nucleotide-binding protein, UspA family [Halanaeroarchaeum sp. HSR-CO]|uniref:universal stress protein n=1 Tax=Halanaeroarchaeum sp. HSR-CO TaxID=2866382 RepID=UPI00217EEEE3|nr:universal stress protein [Halanaeroarchaeum sp. HSR-CO]UWG47195.1 Nucleotide-binding protein, UspA family [Halanaeroarchaeum sp. HSR-CO]
MYDRLLVPIDGSPESLEAVDEAAALAGALDAELTGLYVVDTRDYSTIPEAKWISLADELEREGERALEEAERRAEAAGVTMTTVVDRGIPHDSIIEYADEIGADVIVMSTHGRTGLDRFLLGSVTEKVIRSTELPVLVIRAQST